jgi:uncharacterized protein YlzI (FlbEa/FlbD family)
METFNVVLAQFTRWSVEYEKQTAIAINPARVESVVDYCGIVEPGCLITLMSKETFLVKGTIEQVLAKLKETPCNTNSSL